MVTGLDIGNFWSARYIATFLDFQMFKESSLFCSLEVLVGRAGWDTGQKEVLLPKFELMNRFELTSFLLSMTVNLINIFYTETNVAPGKTRKR